jgi:hypothetical protein
MIFGSMVHGVGVRSCIVHLLVERMLKGPAIEMKLLSFFSLVADFNLKNQEIERRKRFFGE